MARRRKTRGQTEETELEKLLGEDEEDEIFFQNGANFYQASSSKFTHSANPNEECRFILLGGDEGAKKDVCRIIFRNQQNQQRTELEDWELQENRVQGRHVTMAVSPPSWLEHLRSFFLFFLCGISSIKNDIKKCVSVTFPGPNAFLLVIRDGCDNGNEHFLLNAVASVFGKEALDYSMVLLIKDSGEKRSDPCSMKCVMRCDQRLHVLEDTDSSVQELFSKVLKMIGDKKRKFFIPPAYEEFMETEFKSWENRRISNMNEFLAECLDEKDNLIGELRKELDASKKSERERQKKLDASKKSERELQNELDVSKKSESELQKKLDASKKSESELLKKLYVSKKGERELQKELEAIQLRETKLIKELDDFRRNECNPGRLLDSDQQRESEVNKEDCGVKKDNTVQEPQASGTRNRRGSNDFDVPNLSTDQTHHHLGTI